ncbi:hypothetical protein CROQUDRAFT_666575 [Cronartium quercuum f. sp. fusiforme G11]|uniref:Uncharacterized protein n=1 Tax=Cronartium quercuum f. sp. fusiforme G11 TaxID=708437 RepID=A0A9P6N8V3_9BASI|nr:hypothetical protein CROQUDRAFT_666575 [Cronartium quercuum f. sp. fusiforme G11]
MSSSLLRPAPFSQRGGFFHQLLIYTTRRPSSSVTSPSGCVPVDALCVPLHPIETPSLSRSCASPSSLSDVELIHLHQLAALKAPPIGSPEFSKLKSDLLAMFKVVDSVKTFLLGDTGSDDIQDSSAQELVFVKGKTQAVPWNELIEAQEAFIKSKAETIPGTRMRSQSRARSVEPTTITCSEAALVIGMAEPGVHLFKRKGIGHSPQKESLYYAVKRAREENA